MHRLGCRALAAAEAEYYAQRRSGNTTLARNEVRIKPRQVTEVFGDIGKVMGLEREIVACVGSSSTAARGTYDWIAELGKRPRNERFRFLNFGVGGDLSHNVVRRLDAVAATKPDRVIVLIGSNDILASVFPNFRRFARLFKGLSGEPSPEQLKHPGFYAHPVLCDRVCFPIWSQA